MMNPIFRRFHPDHYLSAYLVLGIDLLISTVASIAALLLVGWVWPSLQPERLMVPWAACAAGASLLCFLLLRSFRSVIRHSSLREIARFVVAVTGKEVLLGVALWLLPAAYPFTVESIAALLFLDLLLTLSALVLVRVAMIVGYDLLKNDAPSEKRRLRILVYGTGDKSVATVTRLQHSPHYHVVGFLTYGRRLKGHRIAECPIYYFGTPEHIAQLQKRLRLDAILFARREEAIEEQERLVQHSIHSGLKVLITPPIDEVVDGKIRRTAVREIKIEDLLGRPEIKISMKEVARHFRGKRVLVTGAAGSIGSELCRQLAALDIKELAVFDNAETPMHNLRLELEERFPRLRFTPIIGDVRQTPHLDVAFRTHRPQVVFHAAAYKHVPLMEENPCEAVLVNVIGTRNVAQKCLKYGVGQMVLVSTDKAVNPTNVMGCSKRLAEIYVQSLGLAIERGQVAGRTQFVTTRFGNVLGSNGSVIPRFREQIARGGPVTVTHPEITRFFMTIPEACRLMFEAAAMASGAQIFVFDMGQPVRITDLARRMILLAGFQPEREIRIEYTGLRPGEKLYEEVLADAENTLPTPHERIRIARVREYDHREAEEVTWRLEELARAVDTLATVRLMKRTVAEYKSQNSPFEQMDRERMEYAKA